MPGLSINHILDVERPSGDTMFLLQEPDDPRTRGHSRSCPSICIMRVDEFLIVGLLRRADTRMTRCSEIGRMMKFGRATIAPQWDN